MARDIVTIDLGFVNAYVLKAGDRFVLVDTGMASQWSALSFALEAAGCSPSKLKLVVLSHADIDHVGNARRLRAEWGTPIAVNRRRKK